MRAWQLQTITALCLCFALAGPSVAGNPATSEILSVHYNARVPYAYLEHGRLKGIMAEPVERGLRSGKIPFNWVETPFNRQMATIKNNSGFDCMIGVFKKPGREKFGRYSAPAYRDNPQVLLIRAEDEATFKSYPSLSAAMTDGPFRLLVKESYSYGPTYDALLLARKGPTDRVYDENEQMLRMLTESLADAMIVTPEEATALIRHRGLKPDRFAYIRYPDSPPGELRHLFCSLNVPQSLLDQFNRGLPPVTSAPVARTNPGASH